SGERLESGAGQQQRQNGGPQAAAVPGVRARGGGRGLLRSRRGLDQRLTAHAADRRCHVAAAESVHPAGRSAPWLASRRHVDRRRGPGVLASRPADRRDRAGRNPRRRRRRDDGHRPDAELGDDLALVFLPRGAGRRVQQRGVHHVPPARVLAAARDPVRSFGPARVREQGWNAAAIECDCSGRARLPVLGGRVLYDLRSSDLRVRWLVTLLLATLGVSYLFGAWMVRLYAGFTPRSVAETYGPAGEMPMTMQMPPE